MKGNPEERAVQLGEYITETGATVRSAAKAFGISKSTVHKDITYRWKSRITLCTTRCRRCCA